MANIDSDKSPLELKLEMQSRRIIGKGTDATLVWREKSFKVHKSVLTKESTYFKRLFENHPEIADLTIDNVDHGSMSDLLDFIYLGRDVDLVIADWKHAEEMLIMADTFESPNAYQAICDTIQRQFLCSKVLERYIVLHQSANNRHTRDLIDRYLKKHWIAALDEGWYLQCDAEKMSTIIDSCLDSMKSLADTWPMNRKLIVRRGCRKCNSAGTCNGAFCNDESTTLAIGIIRWLNHDQANRKCHTTSMFTRIDPKNLSTAFIRQMSLSVPVIRNNCDVMYHLMTKFISNDI